MENFSQERVCACALGHIFGYRPRYATALIEKLGSASAIFRLSKRDLDEILGPHSNYKGMISQEALDASAAELDRLEKTACRYIACTEPAYPSLLRECPDGPAGLYFRSSSSPEEIFAPRPAIAIVGTRDVSPYGRQWTAKIVEACSQAPEKPLIVSGLAYGVDITAHISALESGLPTIAVLPCGIDDVYPSSHKQFAARISGSPGSALVTDYPPQTSPAAFTFVRRNRIIAGLARSTVLIESKSHGGGLITCRLADSYGREVFALPGRVDDIRSAGCNALIKTRTAEAVTDLESLGEQLGLGKYSLKRKNDLMEMISGFYASRTNTLDLNALMQTAGLIKDCRGISIEELCYRTGRPYNETARLVSMLEADGFICMDLTQRCWVNAKKS